MKHIQSLPLRFSTRRPLTHSVHFQRVRQYRTFSPFLQAAPQPAKETPKSTPAQPNNVVIKAPQPQNTLKNPDDLVKGDKFTPNPLPKPIGYPYPPNAIDNLPHDLRTRKQKRDDFVNYDKHLQKRQKMVREMSRSYFRDFTNMQYALGKIFVANQRLWKRDLSLWWPNLWGWDVKRKGAEACTVDVFRGVINVVCVFSRTWAEKQIDTFVDKGVEKLVADNADVAQLVEINVEEQKLSRLILWAYAGSLRRRKAADWRQYLVMSSVPEEVREILGMLNHKAGYIFLVDSSGKIRWAGSGDAWEGEKEWLMNGLSRLIQNEREQQATKKPSFGAPTVGEPVAATA